MVTRWAGAKYRHIYSWKGVRRPPIKRISPVLIIIHPDTSMVDVMDRAGTIQIQIQIFSRFEGFKDNYLHLYSYIKKIHFKINLQNLIQRYKHLKINLNDLIK